VNSNLFPPIDLTVVLYRSARFVPALAEGIRSQTYPSSSLRLWFVDNAGGDGAAEDLVARFNGWPGGVVLLPLRKNLGFTGGNNAALRLQKAPFALLLNPDTKLGPDCVARLVARAGREPQAGIVEPRQEPRQHPKPFDPATGETSWCSLGCALIRREALQAAGPLDDLFFLYCEDVDFSWRVRLRGFQCLYEPTASYEHFTGDSGRSTSTEIYYAFRNQYFLRRIYGSALRAEGRRVWWILRSWACAHPMRDGAVIRKALRDGAKERGNLDRRRRSLPGSNSWIGFSSVHLGPKHLPVG
jgi:GT2 family glycosyltransferase